MKVIDQINLMPEPYRSLLLNQAYEAKGFGPFYWPLRAEIEIPEHSNPFGFAIHAAVDTYATAEGQKFWRDVSTWLDHGFGKLPIPHTSIFGLPVALEKMVQILVFARERLYIQEEEQAEIFDLLTAAIEELALTKEKPLPND